jgi:hypothetical protein
MDCLLPILKVLQIGQCFRDTMKKLLAILLLCGLALPALAQTPTAAQCFLSNLQITPSTNRYCAVQPMSMPSVSQSSVTLGDVIPETTDATGQWTITNIQTGLYFVTVFAPTNTVAAKQYFEFYITGTNLGTVQVASVLVANSTATFPAGNVAWATTTSDQRYAQIGTAGISAAAGTNIITSTNGSTITVSAGTNIALLNGTNTFTASNNFTGGLYVNGAAVSTAASGQNVAAGLDISTSTNGGVTTVNRSTNIITGTGTNIFGGTNNFTGPLQQGGVPVLTNNQVSAGLDISITTNGQSSTVARGTNVVTQTGTNVYGGTNNFQSVLLNQGIPVLTNTIVTAGLDIAVATSGQGVIVSRTANIPAITGTNAFTGTNSWTQIGLFIAGAQSNGLFLATTSIVTSANAGLMSPAQLAQLNATGTLVPNVAAGTNTITVTNANNVTVNIPAATTVVNGAMTTSQVTQLGLAVTNTESGAYLPSISTTNASLSGTSIFTNFLVFDDSSSVARLTLAPSYSALNFPVTGNHAFVANGTAGNSIMEDGSANSLLIGQSNSLTWASPTNFVGAGVLTNSGSGSWWDFNSPSDSNTVAVQGMLTNLVNITSNAFNSKQTGSSNLTNWSALATNTGYFQSGTANGTNWAAIPTNTGYFQSGNSVLTNYAGLPTNNLWTLQGVSLGGTFTGTMIGNANAVTNIQGGGLTYPFVVQTTGAGTPWYWSNATTKEALKIGTNGLSVTFVSNNVDEFRITVTNGALEVLDAVTQQPRLVFNPTNSVTLNDTNGVAQIIMDRSGNLNVAQKLTNSNIAASSVVGTDANKTLTNITIGSGLSFSGNTLSAPGGAPPAGFTNFYFDGTQFLMDSQTNVHIIAGASQTNLTAVGSAVIGASGFPAGTDNIILGGPSSTMGTSTFYDTIAGGSQNSIGNSESWSFIGSGTLNVINTSLAVGDHEFIGSGVKNVIFAGAENIIGGGSSNTVNNGSIQSSILGGYFNMVGGSFSQAAGHFAQATNNSAYVWNDSSVNNGIFNSVLDDTYIIHASNGVAINTNNPHGSALFINGSEHVTTNLVVDGQTTNNGLVFLNKPGTLGSGTMNILGQDTSSNEIAALSGLTVSSTAFTSPVPFTGSGSGITGVAQTANNGSDFASAFNTYTGNGNKVVYVGPLGSDSNPGTNQALPKLTIQSATNAAQAGWTIQLLPGVWNTSSPIAIPANVNLKGSGQGISVINWTSSGTGNGGSDLSGAGIVWAQTGSNYFSDFTFNAIDNNSAYYTYCMTVNNQGNNITNQSANVVIQRVSIYGDTDCIIWGGTNSWFVQVLDCQLHTHWDALAYGGSSLNNEHFLMQNTIIFCDPSLGVNFNQSAGNGYASFVNNEAWNGSGFLGRQEIINCTLIVDYSVALGSTGGPYYQWISFQGGPQLWANDNVTLVGNRTNNDWADPTIDFRSLLIQTAWTNVSVVNCSETLSNAWPNAFTGDVVTILSNQQSFTFSRPAGLQVQSNYFGNINAQLFTGNGSGLTNLSAAAITNLSITNFNIGYRAGFTNIANLGSSVTVTFRTPMPTTVGTNYIPTPSFLNETLGAANVLSCTALTTNGFVINIAVALTGSTGVSWNALQTTQ